MNMRQLIWRFCFSMVTVVIGVTCFAQNYHFEKGKTYSRNRYMHDDAFKEWVAGMNAGESSSAYMVILCYMTEFGTPRNVSKATQVMDQWYTKDESICRWAAYFWGAMDSGAVDYAGQKGLRFNDQSPYYHYAERYGLKPDYKRVYKYSTYSEKNYTPKSRLSKQEKDLEKILLSYCYWKGVGGASVNLAKAVDYTKNIYYYTSDVFRPGDGDEYNRSNPDAIIGPWGIATSMLDGVSSLEALDKCLEEIINIGVYNGTVDQFKNYINNIDRFDQYGDYKNDRYFIKKYKESLSGIESSLEEEVESRVSEFLSSVSSSNWAEWIEAYIALPEFVRKSSDLQDGINGFLYRKLGMAPGALSYAAPDWEGYQEVENKIPHEIKSQCLSLWISTFRAEENRDHYSEYYKDLPSSFKQTISAYCTDRMNNERVWNDPGYLEAAQEALLMSEDPKVQRRAREMWTKYMVENFSDGQIENYESILSDGRFFDDGYTKKKLTDRYNYYIETRQKNREFEEQSIISSFDDEFDWPNYEIAQEMLYGSPQLESIRDKYLKAGETIEKYKKKLSALDNEKRFLHTAQGDQAKGFDKRIEEEAAFVDILKKEDAGIVTPSDYELFKAKYLADRGPRSVMTYDAYIADSYAIARLKELNHLSTSKEIKAVKALPVSSYVSKMIKEGTKKKVLQEK